MRWLMIALSLWVLAAQAGERNRPQMSTSRAQPEVSEPPGQERPAIQGSSPGHLGPESADPAVRAYWSDGCRREREFGYTTSPNCHHPAYTGGYGFGPPPGPRGHGGAWPGAGWGRGPDTVIINRGGTVIVPHGGVEQPIYRGGALRSHPRR